jgi:hypothetical protein
LDHNLIQKISFSQNSNQSIVLIKHADAADLALSHKFRRVQDGVAGANEIWLSIAYDVFNGHHQTRASRWIEEGLG